MPSNEEPTRARRALPPEDEATELSAESGASPARARRFVEPDDEPDTVAPKPSPVETTPSPPEGSPPADTERRGVLGRLRNRLERGPASGVQRPEAAAREVVVREPGPGLAPLTRRAAAAPEPTDTQTPHDQTPHDQTPHDQTPHDQTPAAVESSTAPGEESSAPAERPTETGTSPWARPAQDPADTAITPVLAAPVAAAEPTPSEPTPNEPTPNEPTPAEPTANEPTPNEPSTDPEEAAQARSPWGRQQLSARLDQRSRTSLIIAGVAAALVVALGIGYALWAIGRPDSSVATSQNPSAVPSSQPPRPLLDDAMMLSDAQARSIDPKAGWKVALTQDGTNANSPQPLCITQSVEGLPTPLQTRLRTLSSSTATSTQALHQADAYSTADEAEQVFEARLGQLGTCADSQVFLQNGLTVTGIGNQAGGIIGVIQNDKSEFHTVLLVRTGRVVDTFDLFQNDKAVPGPATAKAAAALIDDQCTRARGMCSFSPTANLSVPPAGGDQPGFLAAADLPRITSGQGDWGGTNPATDISVVGSQCESIDFATVDGPTARKARTYLLRNDSQAPSNFGMDEVILTLPEAKAAATMVTDFAKSVRDCPKRTLTAKISAEQSIDGKGIDNVAVKGKAFTVTQKTDTGTVTFRIAMVSAGNKAIYLNLPNVGEKFDLSDQEWASIALRAGERSTQVR